MKETLIQRLIREKFSGVEPQWREGNLDSLNVLIASDQRNIYYKVLDREDLVYYAPIKGRERRVYCYSCFSVLKAKTLENGDSVRPSLVPYCPKCT